MSPLNSKPLCSGDVLLRLYLRESTKNIVISAQGLAAVSLHSHSASSREKAENKLVKPAGDLRMLSDLLFGEGLSRVLNGTHKSILGALSGDTSDYC